jgi:hypothetical protein
LLIEGGFAQKTNLTTDDTDKKSKLSPPAAKFPVRQINVVTFSLQSFMLLLLPDTSRLAAMPNHDA